MDLRVLTTALSGHGGNTLVSMMHPSRWDSSHPILCAPYLCVADVFTESVNGPSQRIVDVRACSSACAGDEAVASVLYKACVYEDE
jgi:hypothetical protein